MDMEEVLLLSSMKWVASLVYPCYSFLGLVGVTSQFSSRAWSDVGFLGNLPSGGCCPDPVSGLKSPSLKFSSLHSEQKL